MSREPSAPDPSAISVGRAAARLLRKPSDLSSWWELCAALAGAGRPAQAARAYADLGRAASELGHPALAVACACALEQAGEYKAAADLVEQVAADHGSESKKVDPRLRSSPPAPPAAEPAPPGPQPDEPADLDAAGELAGEAVAAAAVSAASRAPDVLALTPLLGVLKPDEIVELCTLMHMRPCAPGEIIVDVGQPAKALYWIARGTAAVTREGHNLGELRPNQFFGEIALVSGTTRTARVSTFGPALLLEVPAQELEELAGRAPHLASVLARYARTRLLASVMRLSELFSRLTEEEHQKLLPLFDTELFDAGDRIVESGSHDQRLYVVASGSCQVKDGDEVLAVLRPGDGIGEMSLLARQPASFDVVAMERTVALSLSRQNFDEVAVDHPGLLAEVYKLLVQRESQSQALVHDASDLVV